MPAVWPAASLPTRDVLGGTALRPESVRISVLGPLRVHDDGRQVGVGPPQRRAVLAVLLCAVRQVITTERLIGCVWSERPGSAALSSLHAHMSHLRRILGSDAIVRHSHGYALMLRPQQLDAEVFSQLAAEGRRLLERGESRRGRQQLREALSLWRGTAYEEFTHVPAVRSETTRLDAERLGAVTARIDADLHIGDVDLVGELAALILEHPLHDGLCAHLMLALYRDGRQSEALNMFRQHARRLIEAGGLQPTPSLEELQLRILNHDHR